MHVLLAIAFGIAVFIFVLILVVRDRARSQGLEQQARLLGLSFEDVSHPLEGVQLGRIPLLLENASSTSGFNVLTGTVCGLQVRVFDLRNEAVESPFWTTVAGFHLDTAALPSFELSVKSPWERISEVVKRPRVAVNNQAFGQYSIRCVADQKQTYDFLTLTRLQELRLHLGNFRLACSPEWVFMYRPGFKVEPSDLPRHLERTSKIAYSLLHDIAKDPKRETGHEEARYSHVAGASR